MKGLLIAALLVLVLVLLGWLTFSNSGDRATITIEKQEIREDAEQAAERGQELMDEAAQETRSLIDRSSSGSSAAPPN